LFKAADISTPYMKYTATKMLAAFILYGFFFN